MNGQQKIERHLFRVINFLTHFSVITGAVRTFKHMLVPLYIPAHSQ